MSAQRDIQRSIVATVRASPRQITDACRRAAAEIEHPRLRVDVDEHVGGLRVGLKVRPPRKDWAASQYSWILDVSMTDKSDGRTALLTQVTHHKELQQKAFGFIPMGPSILLGRRELLTFLNAFDEQLQVLEPEGEVALD
jgi:hypothetical protein